MATTNAVIVEYFRLVMAKQDLSVLALSKKIGIPQVSLNRYLNNTTELSFNRARAICKALQIPLTDLAAHIERTETKQKPKKLAIKKASVSI